MKALTVKQPWAWAIAAGHKPIENRSWTTSYRGPLAIHAGKTIDRHAMPLVRQLLATIGADTAELDQPLTRGAVIATAELVDVCAQAVSGGTCACGPWAEPGQHHWRLANVQRLAEPALVTGRLGLWHWEAGEQS
ncbi:ASCH domain-containing protein [Amycolatopsis taiwanensis]|uniref:ASCH domain-containing protein n=1 Tax=Amycolatopsis taiwanensis TaxID=342230 RepID=UPI00048A3F4A|nr:ASCH domain-containing protein [Amycolatopsis taiwanensis]